MSIQDHGYMQQYTRSTLKSWAKHVHYESHCPGFRLLTRRRRSWFSNSRSYNNNYNIYIKCPKTSKWSWNYIYVLFLYMFIFTTMRSPLHQVVLRPLIVLRIDIYCLQLNFSFFFLFMLVCEYLFKSQENWRYNQIRLW